jgi:hypothetical protein
MADRTDKTIMTTSGGLEKGNERDFQPYPVIAPLPHPSVIRGDFAYSPLARLWKIHKAALWYEKDGPGYCAESGTEPAAPSKYRQTGRTTGAVPEVSRWKRS